MKVFMIRCNILNTLRTGQCFLIQEDADNRLGKVEEVEVAGVVYEVRVDYGATHDYDTDRLDLYSSYEAAMIAIGKREKHHDSVAYVVTRPIL